MATNNSVNSPLSGTTGTGNFVGSTSPTITTPVINGSALNQTASNTTFTGSTALSQTFVPYQTNYNELSGYDFFEGAPFARIAAYKTGAGSIIKMGTSNNYGSGITNTAVTIDQSGVVTLSSALPVSSGGTGVTTSTGTGSVVLSTSPTLVTPALGTPSSGTLTNCTGLPVAGGGTGLASTTAYAVLCGGTTSTGNLQSIASVGTSGQVLTSNGAGALPTFQSLAASSSAYVLISTGTASSSASIDFTDLSTTYSAYKIIYNNLYPGTTNTQFVMLFSTNNGSSFITSAYEYTGMAQATGSYAAAASTNSSSILLSNSLNFYTITNTVGAGEITLFNPAGSQATKLISHTGVCYAGSPISPVTYTTMGAYITASAVNAVRLQMSSGNIGTGTFKLYGILA